MKNLYLIIIILFTLPASLVLAQEEDYPYYKKDWQDSIPEKQHQVVVEEVRSKRIYDDPGTFKPSISVGLGVMNSEDINNYIRDDLYAQGVQLLNGSSDMTSALLAGVQLSYIITPRFQAKAILDFAIGISSTEIINQSEFITYTASRISIGLGANYYFGEKRVNPYIGGALFYHSLNFEGYKGSTVGPRFEPGVAFNFTEKFKMEAFFQLDVAEAKAKKLNQSMNIDFSSIGIGARFLFNLQ